MQFTLHAAARRTPHGAARLVQTISAWLVKTRRAPSRHSRDARVYGLYNYGHTQLEWGPPSPPPPPAPLPLFFNPPPSPEYDRYPRRQTVAVDDEKGWGKDKQTVSMKYMEEA